MIDRILAEVDRAEAALAADHVVDEVEVGGSSSAADKGDMLSPPVNVADPPPHLNDPGHQEPKDVTVEVDEAAGLVAEVSRPAKAGAIPGSATHGDGTTAVETHGHAFAPAHTDVVGEREVLDTLSDRRSAAVVREQLVDVAEAEGPVELSRLIRLVARRFDLGVVRANREQEIAALIPRTQLHRDRKFGTFVWPAGVDPDTWTGYRTLGPRSIDEVATQEIANAMRSILSTSPGLGGETLIRRSAELMGISRIGANVRARLEGVYANLPGSGSASAEVTRRDPPPGL